MAAEVLATAGVTVTVYEHMPSLGRKLLLAGRGGLNITHSESLDALIERYGAAAAWLDQSLRTFGPAELRAWCASLGEPTFVGSSGRVFPASFRATPLLRSWLARLRQLGVTIAVRHQWQGWTPDGSLQMQTPEGPVHVRSDVTVLAMGGGSWPRVGSSGAWVDVVRSAGITVHPLRPANCGVRLPWSAQFAQRFAGVPLKNVAVTVDGVTVRGDAMVTSAGLEGGPVYAHSSAVRDRIDHTGSCVVAVDLHPDLSIESLAERLGQRRPKDSSTTAIRRTIGLPGVAVGLMREAVGGALPTEPASLAALVKAVPLQVDAVMPLARAISSAGGVALDEVRDDGMLHRLPGTFVIGEMLDWDAPTGGYLLQASFSTAVAAANGAVQWLSSSSSRAWPRAFP
jgi:uncharacterized flavoprotein (TIGR03862 family)